MWILSSHYMESILESTFISSECHHHLFQFAENKENGCWCANGGTCEYHNHIYGHSLHHASSESATCKCRKGYAGKHCERALCRPGCANGGLCVAPDVCSCPDGFTGARCQTGRNQTENYSHKLPYLLHYSYQLFFCLLWKGPLSSTCSNLSLLLVQLCSRFS